MTDLLAGCPGPAQYDNGGVACRTICKGAHRATALPQMQMSCHQTGGQEKAPSPGVKKPEAREGKVSSRNKQDSELAGMSEREVSSAGEATTSPRVGKSPWQGLLLCGKGASFLLGRLSCRLSCCWLLFWPLPTRAVGKEMPTAQRAEDSSNPWFCALPWLMLWPVS